MAAGVDVVSVLTGGSAFKSEVASGLGEQIPIEHLKRNCQLFLQVSIEEFRRQLETFMLTTLDTMERQYKETLLRRKDGGGEEEENWLEKGDPDDGLPEGKADPELLQKPVASTASTIEAEEPRLEPCAHFSLPDSEEKLCVDTASTPQPSSDWPADPQPSRAKISSGDSDEAESMALETPKDEALEEVYYSPPAEDTEPAPGDLLSKLPLLLKARPSMVPSTPAAPPAPPGPPAPGAPLWCHTCERGFPEALPFELHVRGHELDKKCVKCFHCGKTFASGSNLKRHRKIHTGVRPHVCAFCARPFLNRSDLVRHWRIHTGERPYRCGLCQHAFKYSFNLKTHQQKYHSLE